MSEPAGRRWPRRRSQADDAPRSRRARATSLLVRLALAIVPAAVVLVFTKLTLGSVDGTSFGDFQLNIPDDAYYWHQLVTASAVGNDGGYTVYEEHRAVWSHFGAWGPAYPLLFGALLRVVSIEPTQLVHVGHATFLALSAAAMWIARPRPTTALLLTVLCVVSWALPIGLLTAMQEPMHFGIAFLVAALTARAWRSPSPRWPLAALLLCLAAMLFRPAWGLCAFPALLMLARGRGRVAGTAIVGGGIAAVAVMAGFAFRLTSPLPYDTNPMSAIPKADGLGRKLSLVGDNIAANIDIMRAPMTQYQFFRYELVAVAVVTVAILAQLVRLALAARAGRRPTAPDGATELAHSWRVAVTFASFVLLPFALVVVAYSMQTGVRHLGPHHFAGFVFLALVLTPRRRIELAGLAVAVLVMAAAYPVFRGDVEVETQYRFHPIEGQQPMAPLAAYMTYDGDADPWCNTVTIAARDPFTRYLDELPRGIGASFVLAPPEPLEPKAHWLIVADIGRPQFAESTWARYDVRAEAGLGQLLERRDDDCPASKAMPDAASAVTPA